jgi:lipid A 4'-phosphatase
MSALFRRYGDVLLTLVLVATFAIWPTLDLMLVEPFYQPGVGFPASQIWWVNAFYVAVARAKMLALIMMVLLLAGYIPLFRARWRHRRKALAYLLVALALGPGLIINTVFKDNWGRPRPLHLEKFGGSATFTPVLVLSKQCHRNCSFASGHAGAAFFPMAGYWLTRKRRWLVAGIAFGLFIGFLRMAMGAHFLSDILFAGLIVHFTCRYLAFLFGFPGSLPAQGALPDRRQARPRHP